MDKPQKRREKILREMAGIERMEKGRLTPEYREIEREGQTIRRGPYDKHQCWVNGAKLSRRVRVEEAEALSEAVDGYHRFKERAEEYAELTIAITQAKAVGSGSKEEPR